MSQVLLVRESVNDQGKRGADFVGREVGQTRPQLPSADVEVAEESGLAEGKDVDAERLYLSPSITSIPHDGKPDSA
jgi:hypothetical protein